MFIQTKTSLFYEQGSIFEKKVAFSNGFLSSKITITYKTNFYAFCLRVIDINTYISYKLQELFKTRFK